MNRPTLLTLLMALAILTLTACSGCGAPKAKVIDGKVAQALQESAATASTEKSDEATANDEQARGDTTEAATEFDHSAYGELLQKHSRYGEGLVDYAALEEEESTLDDYLSTIENVELSSLSRDAQLALLLNAYNAYTLKLILENYGDIESIRDLSDPWKTKRYKVAGDTLSLDDIEHGLIRPIFKDPRIHFAVNCASIGCPPLADFAFTGDKLDEQLDLVTEKALSNDRYATVKDGKLHLTKIMDWYGEDFTKEGWSPTAESLPAWVAPRSTDAVRAYVEKGNPKVAFLEYDWSLNDVD